MAPEALMDDGMFDLCIAGEPSRPKMILLIAKFLRGAQKNDPYITFSRSRKAVVESAEGMLVIHADGETICTAGTRIEVEIMPNALEIIYKG